MVAPLDEAGLMRVTAIVVNFNAGEALQRCVQGLLSGSLPPRVLVVDNASTDGSAAKLRQLYGSRPELEILFNPGNLGYAPAVNHAVRLGDAEMVLVINPDCVIGPDGLRQLKMALDADSQAALAAPAVRDSKGRQERAALRRFPDPWNSLVTFSGLWRLGRWLSWLRGVPLDARRAGTEPFRAEAVSGACMLIRRQAMLEVGLFDEAYGLHCEDLDLMFRLREAGWHCLYVPGAEATHEQGVSSRSRPYWAHWQKHLGMARFFDKFQAQHHAAPVRWLVHAGIWLHYLASLPLVRARK